MRRPVPRRPKKRQPKHLITVDLRMLDASGIGTYLRNVVPGLIGSLKDARVALLGDVDRLNRHAWAHSPHVRLIACRSPIYSISEQWALARAIPAETRLFWAPHYNIPVFYRGRLLVTVHDVLHLARPEYARGMHKRLYVKGMFASIRRRAGHVLCPSEFTRQEYLRVVGPGHQRIHVTPLGVDPAWFCSERPQGDEGTPFLLYVGNIKAHKNLGLLLRAFELVAGRIPHDLILVGKNRDFRTGDDSSLEMIGRSGARVRATGCLDDGQVRRYVSRCDALIMPSLYEGFGLPPLEAMACGRPVIVSRAASLPEVCGDAALYFDPNDPAELADQIVRLTSDAGLRRELQHRGIRRAEHFSWDRTVRATCRVLHSALQVV